MIIGYCYPRASTLKGALLVNQNLTQAGVVIRVQGAGWRSEGSLSLSSGPKKLPPSSYHVNRGGCKMGHLRCLLFLEIGLLSNLGRYSVEYRLMTWSSDCVDFSQTAIDGVHRHKLTPRLSALRWQDVSRFLQTKLSLGALTISQVCVNRT